MSEWTAGAAVLLALGTLVAAPAAQAATLRVDEDKQDCPTAQYTSIGAAVAAAQPGDTITVCPGTYVEGPGTPGSNALTIDKSLTLKGAGANLVRVTPNLAAGGRIIEDTPDIRNGVGDVLAVTGTPTLPVTV